jgi:hypothetical protein
MREIENRKSEKQKKRKTEQKKGKEEASATWANPGPKYRPVAQPSRASPATHSLSLSH